MRAESEATSPVVDVVVPFAHRSEISHVMDLLARSDVVPPFDAERVDFVADLSRTLSRRGRGLPETQALAFWMRRSALARLAAEVAAATPDNVVLMPRGTVFHVPPANVDTLFVYSLVLSLLAGNRNIVRLSSRATDQSHLILETLNDTLAEHPRVAEATVMVSYGHEQQITEAISADCDTRIIWGGDATIEAIRRAPLAPHATELTFPDRFSMAAIGVRSYAALTDAARDELAEKFFNDSYVFDQLGCSSPRLLLWVGDKPTDVVPDFHERIRRVTLRRAYGVDTSAAIAKMGQAMRSMIEDPVEQYHRYDNTLTVLDVSDFPHARGDFCGAGLFYEMHLDSLLELVPHVTRADQTLSVFGLARDDLDQFVLELRGRGVDRIVPIGNALAFSRIWDGYDIVGELVRRVSLEVGP